MPTVLRLGKMVFRIYYNDHGPPHVHVENADGTAIIGIGKGGKDGPKVQEVYRMRSRDVARAVEAIAENQSSILDEWRKIHG